MTRDIMKYKAFFTFILLIFCSNITFAQEAKVNQIEKPILFVDLGEISKQEEATQEFKKLLNSIESSNEFIENDTDIKPINSIQIGTTSSLETTKNTILKDNKTQTLKEEVTKTELSAQKRTLKEILKGEKSPNALLFAMYSFHTSSEKDKRNSKQDLLGLQYDGKVFMYFRNSFYHSTVIAGLSRDVYKKQLTKNTKFDFGYKAGLMYGYHEEYPNLLGITPAILPMFGLTYKGKGIDMYLVPDFSPTFIFNVRFELPNKKINT